MTHRGLGVGAAPGALGWVTGSGSQSGRAGPAGDHHTLLPQELRAQMGREGGQRGIAGNQGEGAVGTEGV